MSATAVPESPAVVTEIALVDLSSIAYPIYMMSGAQPDPDYTSREIVARVRSLTATHPKTAICCDKGKSFRHDISQDYKANRPEREAALHHQIALAVEQLQADGYPVWAVKGFEADDLIATATTVALGLADTTVLILSADKDLLQLVGPRVRAMSVTHGAIYDEAAVVAKFGVKPSQMRDYLTLVGDTSDNVKGAAGIGPKKAAELLGRYGDLEGVYENLTNHGTQFKPAMATSLRDFAPRMAETRTLIALRTDADIPFAELDNERGANAAPMEEPMEILEVSAPIATAPVAGQPSIPNGADSGRVSVDTATTAGAGVRLHGELVAAVPVEFERQLEPRSLPQAMQLANHMHAAKMFNGYGSPQAVLSTILAGRELGLQAVASLRGFHVIEGKHALAADAMRGLVLRSGQAKYFRVLQRTGTVATFETWRVGDPAPIELSYTVEEAREAYGLNQPMPEKDATALAAKWSRSSYGKHTADMLAARASSKLARLVYADILFGLYAPEELTEGVA